MKNMSRSRFLKNLFILTCCLNPLPGIAQGDSTVKAKESLLYLRYYVINNEVPYLNVQTKSKVGKAFHPQAKVPVNIYLNTDSDKASLIGRVLTNEKGEATVGIPANLATQWKGKPSPTFYAHTDSTSEFGATTLELIMNKSRLDLDTVNEDGTRVVRARLFRYENDTVVPMAGVDMRLAVKRLGGYLNIGDEETYTTDSTGNVQGEFKVRDLPGDKQGHLELVALVDDNDEVGTLENRIKVPWGAATTYTSNFLDRSLFARGSKAPGWLLIMAVGIIVSVWSVIFYLIANIIRIRKLGIQQEIPLEHPLPS
jgi:hypothetical protein